MNIDDSLSTRPDALFGRRRERWSSLLGWLVAATLACASSVAIAAIPMPRGETREWIEFEVASGIGLPEGTWLETAPRGYADLHGGARLVLVERPTRSFEDAPRAFTAKPDRSSYVDLRGGTR